mmetsp:Transcript_122683/g.291752  ORF Transcript_122683/g.291752 Transcript_122683/m.291752 type:complete len:279 (-) Transcript_122683:984-1820(-)
MRKKSVQARRTIFTRPLRETQNFQNLLGNHLLTFQQVVVLVTGLVHNLQLFVVLLVNLHAAGELRTGAHKERGLPEAPGLVTVLREEARQRQGSGGLGAVLDQLLMKAHVRREVLDHGAVALHGHAAWPGLSQDEALHLILTPPHIGRTQKLLAVFRVLPVGEHVPPQKDLVGLHLWALPGAHAAPLSELALAGHKALRRVRHLEVSQQQRDLDVLGLQNLRHLVGNHGTKGVAVEVVGPEAEAPLQRLHVHPGQVFQGAARLSVPLRHLQCIHRQHA